MCTLKIRRRNLANSANRVVCLIVLAICLAIAAPARPAVAQFEALCPPGSRPVSGGGGMMCMCPDGSYANYGQPCAPLRPASTQQCGNVCCNSGFYCSNYGCIPQGSIECGGYHCSPGQKCGSNRSCLAQDADDCGNGQSCKAGTTCYRASADVPDWSIKRGDLTCRTAADRDLIDKKIADTQRKKQDAERQRKAALMELTRKRELLEAEKKADLQKQLASKLKELQAVQLALQAKAREVALQDQRYLREAADTLKVAQQRIADLQRSAANSIKQQSTAFATAAAKEQAERLARLNDELKAAKLKADELSKAVAARLQSATGNARRIEEAAVAAAQAKIAGLKDTIAKIQVRQQLEDFVHKRQASTLASQVGSVRDGAIVFPLSKTTGARVTANFNTQGADQYLKDKTHLGTDFHAPKDTAVVSPVDGTIVYYQTQNRSQQLAKSKDTDPWNTLIVVREDRTGREFVLGHVNCAVCAGKLQPNAPFTSGNGLHVDAGTQVGTTLAMQCPDNPKKSCSHLHFALNKDGIVDDTGKLKPFVTKDGNWGQVIGEGPESQATASKDGWVDVTKEKWAFAP